MGRPVEHRLLVRWPALAHAATSSVLRLPESSRLKRTILERNARAAYEAWNGGDFQEVAKAAADPEIEVHFDEASESLVGASDVYYGPDGYCEAMADWNGSWRKWRIEIEDVVQVAWDKVLVTARHFGTGLESGVEVEQWEAGLYTFRRGKIVRLDAFLFSDRARVEEAVRSIVGADRG